MNTKNNKRRQETIKKIETIFLEYLQQKEISQIKVSDICKKAEINRSTFYANFTDVYDLADKIRLSLEDEVNKMLKTDVDWQNCENDFLKLFEHIMKNQRLYYFYFKLGYDNCYDLKLFNAYESGYDINKEFVDYHIEFFKNGFNSIVKKWLYGGCKDTPEQMRDILLFEYRGRFEK